VIPPEVDRPLLSFAHLVTTAKMIDGGNLKISVDGGPWSLVPACAMRHNPYRYSNTGGGNPLSAEPMWAGFSEGWITTLVDLSDLVEGGETIELAFEFGDRLHGGYEGWYVDDVYVYACSCINEQDCDDDVFCNGIETCAVGLCHGTAPCPSEACDEIADGCLPTAFFDGFEDGNAQGWDLRAPGSTATEGDWVVGDPTGVSLPAAGLVTQPFASSGGCSCAFTGENSGDVHQSHHGDVDYGTVFLVSPRIDLSGQSHAALTYARWFYVRDATRSLYASFTVDASADDGVTWLPIEVLTQEDVVSYVSGAWAEASHRLETAIPLTNTVRIRFGAREDTEDFSDIVEAAVDDVAVTVVDLCAAVAGDSDCNYNGRQDWCDLEDNLSPDCNSNGIPDECDIATDASPDCQPNGVPDECDVVPEPFIVEFPLDDDPGWTLEGLWEFGTPRGIGDGPGGFDPRSGRTGDNVYGYNHWGHYEDNLPERNLTTGPIDCSQAENVHLSFWRWLCVEQPPFDYARVQVGNDGVDWTTIWTNDSTYFEWEWRYQDFDISEWADGRPTVYVRWTMGPTDESWEFCGWNIDDIIIYGDSLAGVTGDCNSNRIPDECDVAPDGASSDSNNNGVPDECEAAIPTVNEWGMVVMTLLLLVAGTLVFSRRRLRKVSLVG
jgi:hypothetical protein